MEATKTLFRLCVTFTGNLGTSNNTWWYCSAVSCSITSRKEDADLLTREDLRDLGYTLNDKYKDATIYAVEVPR